MANIHKRTFIVLMIISIITFGKVNYTGLSSCLLTHSYNSSHTQQEGVLSQVMGEDLIFNYIDSFSESTFHFSWLNLNLTYYNKLTINFMIEGDKSSKAGILVSFLINTTIIDFLIEKVHQHSYVYTLERGFYYAFPSVADIDISVTCQGQATYGNSGSLILFANSSISSLTLVDLSENDQSLVVSPNNLLFEGNMVGLKEISAYTAFNNIYNNSYIIDLLISFQSSDFQSFTNEISILYNSVEIDRKSFEENTLNTIDFQFEIPNGITFLEILFSIEVSSDIIEIDDIDCNSKVIENTYSSYKLYTFNWINSIDETVNLNVLKPESSVNEHIVNISLYCNFEGTIVLNGINYEIYFGLQEILSGKITVSQQNGEIHLITLYGYTSNYQDDLKIKFNANASGSGIVTIFNNSYIKIQGITHLNAEKYLKLLEESISFDTPSYGSITKNYFDVVFIDNSSLTYTLEFLMEFSVSDISFQSISLSIYKDDTVVTTKSITNEGDVHFILDIQLHENYNEIRFNLNILGQGATITFENMRYSLLQNTNESNNPLIPNDDFNIPFFKVPKNIFLGIFVLFDCWLVMGIMLRIYRGRKLRKKQQAENDEYILEIAQLSQE